jgi:hypothetical protein
MGVNFHSLLIRCVGRLELGPFVYFLCDSCVLWFKELDRTKINHEMHGRHEKNCPLAQLLMKFVMRLLRIGWSSTSR